MGNSSVKIIVIDDEESIRDSIGFHLEDLGYNVVTAVEPTACPVYYHENCTAEHRCADVLIIDQNMPNMTGAEFIEKQTKRGCKLPTKHKLIMTGVLTDDLRNLAKKLGCPIVQKPFSLEDLDNFVLIARGG